MLLAQFSTALEEPVLHSVVVAAAQSAVVGAQQFLFTAQLLEGAGQERLDLRSGERGFMVGRPRSGMFKQFLFGQEPAGRVDRIEDHVVPFVQRAFLAFALFGPSRLSGGLGGSFGLPGPAWAALHHTGNGRFRAGGPDRSGWTALSLTGSSASAFQPDNG